MISNKLGVQLYTLRDYFHTPRELASVLKKIDEIGYAAVELACVDNMFHEDVVKAVEESGLQVASSHIGWDRLKNETDTVIKELKDFNCDNVVIPIVIDKKYRSDEGVLEFIGEVKELSAALTAEGISLHYHNHNHEMCQYGDKPWLQRIYDGTTAEELGAELDIYWIQAGGGDPIQWVRRYKDRQKLIHLKDFVVKADRLDNQALGVRLQAGVGAEQQVTEVGNGNMNIAGVLEAADEAGVDWYIVEQDEAFELSALDCIRISFKNIVKIDAERRV